jgi:hypothetical protein
MIDVNLAELYSMMHDELDTNVSALPDLLDLTLVTNGCSHCVRNLFSLCTSHDIHVIRWEVELQLSIFRTLGFENSCRRRLELERADVYSLRETGDHGDRAKGTMSADR